MTLPDDGQPTTGRNAFGRRRKSFLPHLDIVAFKMLHSGRGAYVVVGDPLYAFQKADLLVVERGNVRFYLTANLPNRKAGIIC